MTRAAQIIADAVAAVVAGTIATAIGEELSYPLPGEAERAAACAAARVVRDLRADGWHITALPVPASHQEGPR